MPRTLPAVVWLALSDLLQDVLQLMDGTTDADFDRRLDNLTFAGLYLLTLAASVVVPAVGAWLAVRLGRRWVLHGRGLVTAGLVAAGYVLIWPVAERLLGAGYSYVVDVFLNALAVAILVVLTAVGVGSIGGWALRAVLRQLRGLGVMTSRSLRVSMFVAVFSALSFIVTVVTDADHRRTFFDPVIAHLRVSLEARASYLSRFANR